MKTLVYRMGGLGDSILIYPVLEGLIKKGYTLTVWGNPEYYKLAELAGFCSKTTFYEPKEDFDLKIIFSKNKEIFSSFKSTSSSLAQTVFINPIPEGKIWVVDYYLKSLGMGHYVFSKNLNLNFNVKKCPGLCIIHPGSGSKKKNPEPEFFIKLRDVLNKAGWEVIYIAGPAEKEVMKNYQNTIYVENQVDLAKNLLKASLYIGLDSGVSHLSSYLGIPSIVIFGPTDPEVWHPVGEHLINIRYAHCPPCFPSVCKEKFCLHQDFLIGEILSKLKKFNQRDIL
jgi:ADP-heptose:LPS heptosyltransferase